MASRKLYAIIPINPVTRRHADKVMTIALLIGARTTYQLLGGNGKNRPENRYQYCQGDGFSSSILKQAV